MKQINRDENLSYIKKHPEGCDWLFGAGEENRTLTVSLEGWSSTIKLHPHFIYGLATSYSRTCVLPSALRSLTSVFGMGTGVPSLPLSLDLLSDHPHFIYGLATSYSRTCVLPSALRSLTSVFGMGTGVPSLPLSLDLLSDFINLTKINLTKLDIFCFWIGFLAFPF